MENMEIGPHAQHKDTSGTETINAKQENLTRNKEKNIVDNEETTLNITRTYSNRVIRVEYQIFN